MNHATTASEDFTTATGRRFQVTRFSVTGSKPGLTLTLIAGQHGMEHSGPNVLSLFMKELREMEFSGTVHVCPRANPLALEMDYEFYPENEDLSKIDDYFYSRFRHDHCPWGLVTRGERDGYNMNRLWGKTETPGVAAEVARWLWDETCEPADVIIDMHCLQGEKPLIFSVEKSIPVAKYFGAEAIFPLDPVEKGSRSGNLLEIGSRDDGRYSFCVEFSAQHGLKQSEYEWGLRGIRNVMKAMGMTSGTIDIDKNPWRMTTDSVFMTTRTEGHVIFHQDVFSPLRKGDEVYEIVNVQTSEIVERGVAEKDGVLSCRSHKPVLKAGEMACQVTTAEELVVNDLNAAAGEYLFR